MANERSRRGPKAWTCNYCGCKDNYVVPNCVECGAKK